jgi:hypothetical protein
MLVLVQRCGSALAAIAVAIAAAALFSIHAWAEHSTPLKVGMVTRHAQGFVGHHVLLSGYLLARDTGYILFSDEPRGRISRYDLPVAGAGIDQMMPRKRYVIEGEFLDRGFAAGNGSRYQLELSAPPRLSQR